MNYPFSFTFTGAGTEFGILWNPWGSTPPATAIDNATLVNLVDPLIVNLIPPTGPFWITDFTVMTNATGDADCTIGYYDTATTAFVALYPIVTTAVAGSGVVHQKMASGFRIPAGSTRIPCIRYDGASGSVITGDIGIFAEQTYVGSGATAVTYDPLLDDAGQPLRDDAGNIIYAH